MSKISNEFVSDSEGESEVEANQVFRAPSDYKKCKHLKRFNKQPGEEVWLIKLPASLDISKLQSLPVDLDSSRRGEPALTFEEGAKTYSIREQNGTDDSNLSLLIPGEDRESLHVQNGKNKVALDKVFTVSEVANIPGINFDKMRVPRSDVVQVEGLRMRHFPTGYNAKDYGIEEEEVVKKRKIADSVLPSSPSKKHKKDKKRKDKKK